LIKNSSHPLIVLKKVTIKTLAKKEHENIKAQTFIKGLQLIPTALPYRKQQGKTQS